MHFHHKGYRFSKDSDIAGGSLGSWRCQRRHAGCTARIHFSKKDNEVVAEFGAHNHDAPVASGEEGISFLNTSSASKQGKPIIDEEGVEEDSLADQLRATEAENKRLRADLANKKKLLVDQKLELDALRQREGDTDPEKASLQQKVNDLQAQLLKSFETSKAVADAKKRLREENAQLKQAQDASKASESRLKKVAEADVIRASQFQQELKTLRTAWEEENSKERFALESIKKEHEQKQFELRKQLEDAEQKASKLADELADQKQRAADDEADLRFLVCQQTQDLFVTQKQLKALRRHVESLNASQAKTLDGDLEALKTTPPAESELRKELASRDEALGQAKIRLEEAQMEVDKLTEAAAKLKEEKDRLEDTTGKLEGDLRALKATSAATETELRKEFAEAVSKLKEEKNRLQGKVETLEGALEAFKASATSTESELRKGIASRDLALSQATKFPEDAQAKADHLKETAEKLDDEKNRLQDTTEYLRNNMRLSEEQRRESDGRVGELEKQLDGLKEEIETLKSSEQRREASESAFDDLRKRFDKIQAGNVRLTEVAGLRHVANKKDVEFCERLSQFMAELTADAEKILEENRKLKDENVALEEANVALKEELEHARQLTRNEPESGQKRMEEPHEIHGATGASAEQLEAIRKELSNRAAECEVLKQWLQKDREQKSALEEKVEELEDELAASKVKLARARGKLAEQRRSSEPLQHLLQAEAKKLRERSGVDSNNNFATLTKPVSSSSDSDALRLYAMEAVGEEPESN